MYDLGSIVNFKSSMEEKPAVKPHVEIFLRKQIHLC